MNHRTPAPSPDTRDRLLDTAERLFAEHGFAGTSVREITDAAGANLGAVNYHFRSKEGLYAEAFARRAALFREPILEAAREAAGIARTRPDRAFLILGRAFLAPHADREASMSLLGLFAREVVEPCLPRRLFVREFLVPTIDAIMGIVREARPDLPEATARACAHAFYAQLMHVAKGTGAGPAKVDEWLDYAVRFTVAAVTHMKAVPPGRSRRATQRKPS
jgi:AcrR family transcriptional regulator